MKKIMSIISIVTFCAGVSCLGYAAARNIIEYFDEKGVIKTHVRDIKNSTGDSNIDVAELKKRLEKAFVERGSHAFKIVSDIDTADIVVDVDVAEYFWTEEDPVDLIFSPIAAAIDKAKAENYARMQADIVIIDVKSGQELWKERVQSTLTDDTMTEKESYHLTYERFSKMFMKKLFKKPK